MKKSHIIFFAIIFMACSLAGFAVHQETRTSAASDTTQSVSTTATTTASTNAATESSSSDTAVSSESTASTDTTPAQSAAEQTTATKADSFSRGVYYKLIDSHLHYLDFLQETDGLEALVKEMDKNNVTHAVIFGMPIAKQWDESSTTKPINYLSNDSRTYYFSATDYMMMQDYLSQPEEIQKRFFPFACGVNPKDKNAASHLRKVLEDYPGKFYGIGELIGRHDDLTALTYGEAPQADSPTFLAIYDLAAEYKIPVLLHHNIGTAYADDPIYLGEIKNALAHNRNAKIIWAHGGVSERVQVSNLPAIAEQMFHENSNLYYDLSETVFTNYINKDENSLKAWTALIEKYPDRFIIGSDVTGKWSDYGKEATKFYSLLDKLSDSTVQKLCSDNILSLMNVDKNSLAK